jgi:signal recognition particle subunit SRP54
VFETLSERLTAALKKLTGRGVIKPEDVDATLREVRLALLEADVNYKVVKEFGERVRERVTGAELSSSLTAAQQIVKVVHDELADVLGANSQGLTFASKPPTVVMLVGLQGSGKTTTAVKLALLARKEGKRPLVAGLDLRRPAAVDQLRMLAEREKVGFHSGSGNPEAIARDAVNEASRSGHDFVVLDTAGRLHVDEELMEELKRIKAAVSVTQTFLVADAMTGQEAVNVGAAFQSAVGVDGVILTKLDGDARGGAALSFRHATGQQIRFAGVGEKPTDLEVFHADRMASRILGMGDVLSLIEKAESSVDKEQAKEVERHLRSGQLTFDDFLLQIRQLRSMGSVAGVMEMLPGGMLPAGASDVDAEAEVKKMESIILSMTPRERAHPEILDGSRRRRVARGSGTEVADVNRLLKQREMIQKLFKQFGLGGAPGRRPVLPGLGRKLFG